MRVPRKADYAIRALLELAVAPEGEWVKADDVAASQEMSCSFLLNIFIELRRPGIIVSQRGREGGFRLGRAPADITVADVLRAIDGPLASVGGAAPEDLAYNGAAMHLQTVWIAVRASLRDVLEKVTLEDLTLGEFPENVLKLAATEGAWQRR